MGEYARVGSIRSFFVHISHQLCAIGYCRHRQIGRNRSQRRRSNQGAYWSSQSQAGQGGRMMILPLGRSDIGANHVCLRLYSTRYACVTFYASPNCCFNTSNSFSLSCKRSRNRSCSIATVFLAASNLSASSFSIACVNSGTPPLEASKEEGLAVL